MEGFVFQYKILQTPACHAKISMYDKIAYMKDENLKKQFPN